MGTASTLIDSPVRAQGEIPPNRRAPRATAPPPRRWGAIVLPLALIGAAVIHYLASRSQMPAPTRTWFVFLTGFFALSVVLAGLQFAFPRVRAWLAETGPILAGAVTLLAL